MGLNVVRTSSVNQIELLTSSDRVAVCAPDDISVQEARAVAARLCRMPERQEGEKGKEQGAHKKSSELVDLLGIADIHRLDLARLWSYKTGKERLRVPIGLNADTSTTYLDIKESAQFGMGPHGMLVGATGSGKSEVLRTLVLSLALTHSPDQLNFVLIDFKGGATFAGMEGMPHVASIITNLGEEASLVDRMQDALTGEMTRRQELLRKAGNFPNVTEYEKARMNGRTDLEAAARAVRGLRRVLRAAVGQAGPGRLLREHRPTRPLPRGPSADRLAAPRGGQAARTGHLPVVPHRPAHVLRVGIKGGARRPRRLYAAQHPGRGLPENRFGHDGPLPRLVRVGSAEGRAGHEPLELRRGRGPDAPHRLASGAPGVAGRRSPCRTRSTSSSPT